MLLGRKTRLATLVATCLSVTSVPARADNDVLEVFSLLYMASHMCVMGTYMGIISAAVASGTHDHVEHMNEKKRREADMEIDRYYHCDQDILNASYQADAKIQANKDALRHDPQVRSNEAIQKQLKKNIRFWMRVKERAEQVKKRQAASAAYRYGAAAGLNVGS